MAAFAQEDPEAFFETKIRPLLASSCVECHGPKKASGGLRLDSHAGLLAGGDTGPIVVSGDVASSLLIRLVRRDGELKMPPDAPLTKQQIDDLSRWVDSGAKWPASVAANIDSSKRHWAFEPISSLMIPVDPTGWANQPIDRFITAGHQQHSLRPVALASKASLLRRAYFDLIGLPPTPEQIQAFQSDISPGAFESVIDELLSSQQYGERWGRHWLDLVRYADTAGDNADYPIPQAYLYRDYVIDAFNADLPYDRFLHEQLAGDILAEAAEESEYARLVIATGFIAQSKRIGTRELEDMHLIIEDTLTTLGPTVLGLSLRCARCHDHKFEPLTMDDYYALYGFFASTQYPFAGAEEVRKQTKFAPLLPSNRLQPKLAAREKELSELKSQIIMLESIGGANGGIEQEAKKQEVEAKTKVLKEKLAGLEKSDPLEGIPTAYAVGELPPVDVPIQTNGDPFAKNDKVVRRGVPKVLDDAPLEFRSNSSGRLELANWITTKAQALAARVMVNRIWQNHFGKPLVATPSDFGFRGTPPSHPELLDWLANEFIKSGWSIKSLHKTIMLSKTYQLSTETDPQNAKVDSGNQWYWRFDRRRLDAESLRDTMMYLSGTLDFSRPGPHPFPEPSKWHYTAHHQFNDVCYPSNHRSVYLMVQRLHAHPYLSLFNGPDPSLATPTRDSSTVPLQALYLMNNDFAHNCASRFAERLLSESSLPQSRINSGFARAFGRLPTDGELLKSTSFIDRYLKTLEAEGVPPDRRDLEAWSAWARALLVSNEFFYLD
jgi:Protein of unknown function (DUF1553)/Protein of unknown function (DUF1549)/Planctomycete cytochrome C